MNETYRVCSVKEKQFTSVLLFLQTDNSLAFYFTNKRAQRALGRSPEEKVKSNSAANYREPRGIN